MGTVIIKVKVGMVFPALKIRVTIDNLEDGSSTKYSDSKSFEHPFHLNEGKYMITVSGSNQHNDVTEIWVEGDFIENKYAKADKLYYSKVFIGTV